MEVASTNPFMPVRNMLKYGEPFLSERKVLSLIDITISDGRHDTLSTCVSMIFRSE
jgi:hypothetical protein